MKSELPEGLDAHDYEASSTVRDLTKLDGILRLVANAADTGPLERIVDLGCGFGGVCGYVGRRLGAADLHGIDLDAVRLEKAAARGLETYQQDLERDPLSFGDGTVDLILSLGALEHMVHLDHVFRESARILREGGWMIVGMPNLGSYVNRIGLLFGYQPRDVEISREVAAGTLPRYRQQAHEDLGHVHSATYRAVRDLLRHHGFVVVEAVGFSPDFGSRLSRIGDKLFGQRPSTARRFLVVARRSARVAR